MENKKSFVRWFNCYTCDTRITFDKTIRSENGKPIPLNPDKTPHNCPNSDYNKRMRQRDKAASVATT